MSECTAMQQQQMISDLNPYATEFVSKEELWFQTKEKEFVCKNAWLFDGGLAPPRRELSSRSENDKDTHMNENEYESEPEPCSTPPQIITDCEADYEVEFEGLEEKEEMFYDCE